MAKIFSQQQNLLGNFSNHIYYIPPSKSQSSFHQTRNDRFYSSKSPESRESRSSSKNAHDCSVVVPINKGKRFRRTLLLVNIKSKDRTMTEQRQQQDGGGHGPPLYDPLSLLDQPPEHVKSFGQQIRPDEPHMISSIFEKEPKDLVQLRRKRGELPIESTYVGAGRTTSTTPGTPGTSIIRQRYFHPVEAFPLVEQSRFGDPRPPNNDHTGPGDGEDHVEESAVSVLSAPSPAGGAADTIALQHLPGYPRRPTRDPSLSKQQLELGEEVYFDTWCRSARFDLLKRSLNYGFGLEPYIQPFEQGLDVWRQLWRTLEQSDALIFVADSRNPILHVPLALVNDIRRDYPHKKVVLVLTKMDLGGSRANLEAWLAWFRRLRVGFGLDEGSTITSSQRGGDRADVLGNDEVVEDELLFSHVFPFTKQPHKNKEEWDNFTTATLSGRRNRLSRPTMKKIELQALVEDLLAPILEVCTSTQSESSLENGVQKQKPTIGVIGLPNGGKSSLLNSIIGTKKLSVSRTAGHTKHIQHIEIDAGGSSGGPLHPTPSATPSASTACWSEFSEPQFLFPASSSVSEDGMSSSFRGTPPGAATGKMTPDESSLSKSERKVRRNEMKTAIGDMSAGGGPTPSEKPTKKRGKRRGGGPPPSSGGGTQQGAHLTTKDVVPAMEDDSSVRGGPATSTPAGSDREEDEGRTGAGAASAEDNKFRVMDCPGLVFPMRDTPLAVLELSGILPLAQVREPLSAVRAVFEVFGTDLVGLYALKRPDWYEEDDAEDEAGNFRWTPLAVCEALADKRNYTLARSGAPDVQRAGLEIIRDCADGVVPVFLAAPAAPGRSETGC